ncbi:MAG TPA: V-type ATPase 116kDa subunit family protein [Candidatus Bathyarchaeia archaeon]|nr:V-type ATPase 116kDa subunit family protein [Candidatus Bathyarchaeia archaeon]
MLRPERMEQVSIIVAKDQLANLLAFTGKHKIFHQIEVLEETLPEGAKRIEAGELLGKASNIRNRTQTLLAGLELGEGPGEKIEAPSNDPETLAKFLDEEMAKKEKEFREVERSEERLHSDMERTSELLRFLSGLEALGVSLENLGAGGFLAALAGEAHPEVTPILQRELDRVTYGNTIFAITKTTNEAESFVAIFPAVFQPDAKQVAATAGAKVSPPLNDLPPDPAKAKRVLNDRLKEMQAEAENLRQCRTSLVERDGPRLRALATLAGILEARTKALSNASTTESTTLLRGWVPADRLDILQKGAPEATAGLVTIQLEVEPTSSHHREKHDEIEHEHAGRTEPPTLVRIPAWTKPLQSVIDNFGLPSYGETNPLPFMLFTFPVVFGLMFGDYGEGILFLALGLALLRAKRKKIKIFEIGQMFVNGAELIVMLGVSMIIFGLIFGDFFGFESQKIFGIPALFNPTQGAFDNPPNISHLLLYMEFVLFFGVAHYLSGLGISAHNKIRAGHYREAFFGPISWAWLYVVFIYLAVRVVVSGYKFSTLLQEPVAIVLFIVPLALQGYWEGGLHAFEVFISAGSNTLSYLRIWALNLADFAIKFAFYSFGGIAGVIAGNLLVMILEGLIVFVQTLRLHWIEWFSKFYEGSGLPFAPYQEPLGWIVLR